MILSKEQKSQLENLLQTLEHPRLKKLLVRAIPIWETEGYSTGTWGVKLEKGLLVRLELDERGFSENGCCLVGAAILGLKAQKTEYFSWAFATATSISDITHFEYRLIQEVFDDGWDSIVYKEHKDLLSESNALLVTEVIKIREILEL